MEEEVEEDEEDESRTARKVYSVKPELENSAEKNLRSVNDDFINLFKWIYNKFIILELCNPK